MVDKSRREFLQATGAATTAATLPNIPLPSPQQPADTLTLAMRRQFGRLSFRPGNQLRQYSDNRVGVHIPYAEGSKAALVEWVNAEDERAVLAEHDAINSLTVQLPVSDLASGITGAAPIDEPDFIDSEIGVDAELTMSIPNPVDLAELPKAPQYSGFAGVIASLAGYGISSTGEVAGDDAESGTVAEARDVTGAPDSLVDSTTTSGVTVAVIDTGLNTAGGQLLGSESRVLGPSQNMQTGDTVTDQGVDAVGDGQGHGTHVTSTIAARPPDTTLSADFRGFLPSCDLLVLKALGDDGSGSTADIARAVTYAADEGVDLICMSLGSPLWSVELDRALAYATGAGAVPFVAAGNNRSLPNPTPFINSPADSPAAISIAAGEVRPPAETRGGSFSAVGPDPGTADASNGETAGTGPALASTGVKLTALTATTTGSLNEAGETLSGTSMATPSAVGAAGLVLAQTGVSGIDELRDRLTTHAARAPRLGVEEAGAGWMDAEAAINETERDQTQKAARNDQAGARDEAWRSLSNAYGGFIGRRVL